jgi:hypothetical protein
MRRLAWLVAVALAVLAVPVSASALGTSATLSGAARGPHGYKVLWSATSPHLGSTNVGVTITFLKMHGKPGVAGYYYQSHQYSFSLPAKSLKLNTKLKTGKLKASLGKFGKLSVTFTETGKLKKAKPAPHCTGPNMLSRLGIVSGKIKFSFEGLKVGKVKKGATATRQSSNARLNCPPDNDTTCFDQVGQESLTLNQVIGTGSNTLSIGAARQKTGAAVTETATYFAQMAAPGTFESHQLWVAGGADRLAQAGGVATLKGAGQGINGTLTLTGGGANTTDPEPAPCATFLRDSLRFPVIASNKLTFGFDTGTMTLDPTAAGTFDTSSWSLLHH